MREEVPMQPRGEEQDIDSDPDMSDSDERMPTLESVNSRLEAQISQSSHSSLSSNLEESKNDVEVPNASNQNATEVGAE